MPPDPTPPDPAPGATPPPGEPAGKSFGNISPSHWSKARRGQNQEALEYYRQRSRAPGVAEGGAERNFYCMQCDGVIPFEPPRAACPHCGAALEGKARRYFNWVELDAPPPSDARALLPLFGLVALLLAGGSLLLWWLLRGSGEGAS